MLQGVYMSSFSVVVGAVYSLLVIRFSEEFDLLTDNAALSSATTISTYQ